MCSPRARGEAVFHEPHFYDKLPTSRVRFAIGLDLAYTAKSHADYSVAVVMAECLGIYYVVEVVRMQCAAPAFAARVKLLQQKYHGAKCYSYAYGPEVGAIDFFRSSEKLRIQSTQMGGDKFVRASPLASAWNKGLVLVPGDLTLDGERFASEEAMVAVAPRVDQEIHDAPDRWPWRTEYLSEFADFTGVNDPRDDQVDATAPAFDALARVKTTTTKGGFFNPGTSFEDREAGI
jgi:phage terminase large subunit-like protein